MTCEKLTNHPNHNIFMPHEKHDEPFNCIFMLHEKPTNHPALFPWQEKIVAHFLTEWGRADNVFDFSVTIKKPASRLVKCLSVSYHWTLKEWRDTSIKSISIPSLVLPIQLVISRFPSSATSMSLENECPGIIRVGARTLTVKPIFEPLFWMFCA